LLVTKRSGKLQSRRNTIRQRGVINNLPKTDFSDSATQFLLDRLEKKQEEEIELIDAWMCLLTKALHDVPKAKTPRVEMGPARRPVLTEKEC